jgi:hypothetical protein
VRHSLSAVTFKRARSASTARSNKDAVSHSNQEAGIQTSTEGKAMGSVIMDSQDGGKDCGNGEGAGAPLEAGIDAGHRESTSLEEVPSGVLDGILGRSRKRGKNVRLRTMWIIGILLLFWRK